MQFCGVSSQQTTTITKLGIQYHPLGCINCYLPIFLIGTLLGIFDWGEVKCNVDLDVDFVVLMMMMMMMMLILLLLLGRRSASTVWVLASSSHVELLVLEL